MWKWIIFVVVALVVAGAVYGSITKSQLVETAVARHGAISAYVEERAKTRLPRTYRLTMPVAGRIRPIDVDEGQRVQAGEIVARLDLADLETAVARARARVDGLRARVVENNDTRLERSMLEGLEHELEAADATVEAALAKTEASRARESYFQTERARLEEALAEGAAAPREVDLARLADIESRVDYRTDVLTLRAIEAVRRALQIGPKAVRQYMDKKALAETVLDREIAETEAVLEQALRDRARAEIAAPIDGVVLHRAVSDERVLPAGELLLEIGRLDELEVEVEVLSEDAVAIAPDDPVEIFGPSIGPAPVGGRVRKIEPRGFTKVSSLGVEQQRVLVIVRFDEGTLAALRESGRELGVDFRVRVRIHTDRREEATVIPRAALFRGAGDAWQTFAVRGGRARLAPVEIGLANDRQVEVTDGLAPGDTVILAPETRLADGDRVRTP